MRPWHGSALPLELLFKIASVVVALVVIAATTAHVIQVRESLFAEADARLRTLSRVLAGQVGHGLGSLEMAFEQLGQPLHDALSAGDVTGAGTLLRAVTQRELLLRELAVVDGTSGRVLASSQPRSIGRDVGGYDFFRASEVPRRFIGVPKRGRGLDDGAAGDEGPQHARAGFLTFSWTLGANHDHRLLVAVIGADSMINDLRYVTGGDIERLSLYRYDGTLLAASDEALLTRATDHPIFRRFLPEREADSFVETADDGQRWVAHFATAAEYPLVVEARLSEDAVLSSMPSRLGVPLGLMTAIVVALFLYTRLIEKALRERRQQEDALRAARDAAESAARAKSRFLAAMSHELRTPMTGILGMVDLIESTGLPAEQARFLRVLRTSAQSLLGVLNDVLDYSKINAGRLDLEFIEFDPAAVVHEVVEMLSPSAARRDNRIREALAAATIGPVRGDPLRLRQVLVNLIGNAIKYTEHGTVTVSITRLAAQAPGLIGMRFEVCDTGIGIAPEVLPTLFHPFQQADNSISRRFGGTGLGLAICRHLVEAMGGRIGADSEAGSGSRFWLELHLPAAADTPVSTAPPTAPITVGANPPRRALRILVAEDNPTIRLLIGTWLQRAGHQVALADDGEQAIAALQREDFDLVLMDMQMPGVDGLEATRVIRALPGIRGRVPIVAVTADVLPESRADALGAGVDAYLLKPIDWQELDRLLGTIVPKVPAMAPTDNAALQAARTDLGDDAHRRLLEVYWRQAAIDHEACRLAVAVGDCQARADAAHSLKGASASVGLDGVAAAADRLEGCAAAEAVEALQRLDERIAAASRLSHRQAHPGYLAGTDAAPSSAKITE